MNTQNEQFTEWDVEVARRIACAVKSYQAGLEFEALWKDFVDQNEEVGTFNQEQESGQGYYSGVRFQMYARDQAGTEYFLVDGGFTDWTQQLLSNRKERLLISGMGSERFVSLFG